MDCLLSIVIPIYNRVGHLPETLATIARAAEGQDVVLILVDNGSTDGSQAVCQTFAQENGNAGLRVVLAEETRRGAACARNKGLSLCQTPFVYFFDSDDAFDADFLTTLLPLLPATDAELLALTSCMEVDGRIRTRAYRPTASPADQILISHLNTISMLFRTDFLRCIGGWNEQLTTWDDWELGVRTLLAQPRMEWFTQRPFHLAKVHGDSQTGDNFTSRFEGERAALRAVAGQMPAGEGTDRGLRRALYLRYAALLGNLKREKSREACLLLQTDIRQLFSDMTRWERLQFRFLCFYVSHGWRGWWQLALLCLPSL